MAATRDSSRTATPPSGDRAYTSAVLSVQAGFTTWSACSWRLLSAPGTVVGYLGFRFGMRGFIRDATVAFA